MKFFCIADEDTLRGFRLAGVDGRVVVTADESRQAIEDALRLPECGIIIITGDAADAARDLVDAVRLERDCPLIIEIPGPKGKPPEAKGLRRFVQEAVGIRLSQSEVP
ncbi:MAG: Vacuolar H+transporting two-sector ATPase subunit [Deltaproteobacteria bacterium]|nr:Vacuolar H+transporting two-sector ATPase subunit [Deltaproteobacteria bacterium]